MTDQGSFRRFEYRPCRITAGFDLEFVAGGKILLGLCEDVSDEGIRATIDGPVSVGSFGLVIFRHGGGLLELEAQVTYTDNCHVGLVFLFQTPWERGMINDLIAALQANSGDSTVIRFP